MAETHIYSTALYWSQERKGVLSSGGLPDIEVATPPEFPKGHPGIWSPEHLFVAAAEVCLMTTFLAIAEKSRLDFSAYSSQAEGTLEKTAAGYLVTSILIRPRVVISDQAQSDRAMKIIEMAEKHCLISNSMKSEVSIAPEILVE
jgi:organic hydroperoxide reductase OsmC/OhrA